MAKLEQFIERLHQMQLDIRLEVVLIDLITEGLSVEDVIIVNNSLFARNYHHDIERTDQIEVGPSGRKKLRVLVNREGIYDRIPEDLFHQPQEGRKDDNADQVIFEIKRQNVLEKEARSFFQPIENEFYRQQLKLEGEERKFLFETNSDLSGDLFNQLWDFPDFLDNMQKSKLGVLMPVISKLVGNLDVTAWMLETISGDRLSIRSSAAPIQTMRDEPRLGQMRLGLDGILGGEVQELHSAITISIEVGRPEDLGEYMPGGKKIIILEFLCNLFIPLGNEVMFELDFSKTSLSFALDDETFHLGRLNYTTVL
jgi:hypothetical protein